MLAEQVRCSRDVSCGRGGDHFDVMAFPVHRPATAMAAWCAHLPVYELTPTHASPEQAFMQVTKDSIEYHAGATR
jgi:ABC-2 type transport system ATP-binding protein